MNCENCNGLGTSKNGEGETIACFFCNGVGEMCDVCGDACDEEGQNVCNSCQEEGEDS